VLDIQSPAVAIMTSASLENALLVLALMLLLTLIAFACWALWVV